MEEAKRIFVSAPFVKEVGYSLIESKDGEATSELLLSKKHQQQHGFVHAGVQATMADHTAGAAATSLLSAQEQVMTIEFKLNFLRPASGTKMICRSSTLRRGKTVAFVESKVFCQDGAGCEKLTATASVTLAIIAKESH